MSIVSLYEAKKLVFTGSPSAAVIANGFTAVAILPADAEAAGGLNWPHKDPFDRLLAVQTTRLGAILVTADAILQQSHIPILWAR